MVEPFRVALLIESSRGYGRNLLAGIAAYARLFGPWTFYHEERTLDDSFPARLKHWRPCGIIARLENKQLIRDVRRLKLPTIGVLHEDGVPDIPGIVPDQKAIAELAIEHFLERRLQHYAYCGFPEAAFSEERCRWYVRRLADRGYSADVFDPGHGLHPKGLAAMERHAMEQTDRLAAWLSKLPKPVGLMACNDMRAFQVLSVCREIGILVPDEVAVMGVDNDTVQCDLCDPPLSSIDNNARQIGYQAAGLLHQMIEHGTAPPRLTFVEPAGVVVRRSTDVLAVADRATIEIVRYVRDHACEGLTPAMLAEHIAMSRSTLERRFAQHLGHSVNHEIQHVRLQRVKELLSTSDLSLAEIARLTGYVHVETMQRSFKNQTGQAPGQYRGRCRRVENMSGKESATQA